MAEIVKCGTCKRPYNAALETCPFCARQQAGYREVIAERAPQHEAFKAARAEIEEGEARVRALAGWIVLAVVLSIPFAIGLSSKVHAVGTVHLSLASALAFAAAAALAWLVPRIFGYEGLELGRRASIFLVTWLAGVPTAYLLITTLMLGAAGAPRVMSCRVSGLVYGKRSFGTPSATRFVCTLPDGSFVSGSEGRASMPFEMDRTFTMSARPSFGGWLYDPESVRGD